MNNKKVSMENMLKTENIVQNYIDDMIMQLIKERKKHRITQMQLSKLVGIPQATISRIESFRTVPTIQILIKLSEALNLELKLSPKERSDNI